jgi:tetratricopeptide (TPR) repeat protein
MISSVVILSALLAGATAGDDVQAGGSELRSYKATAAAARRDPDAHVRLALWCEAHGLTAERLKHLSLAVLYDPSHTLARGLLGLVAFRGKWERPDEVTREVQDDPDHKARIQEYLKRRVQLRERADDHWKLAVWCEQNGLKEQASAHLHQVLRLDPWRENAWKHLGYKRVGGRWIKPDDAAAAKVEAREQQKGNKYWKPVLEKLRTGLESKDRSRRAETAKALAQIADRRAVPMVWATFARGDAALQTVAIQVLGQIDDPTASRSLVMLVVFTGSPNVRRKAIDTLRRRDAREFAGLLIAMIQQPIKYEVKKVGGPGQPGELLIKGRGKTPNVKRVYAPPATPSVPLEPGDRVGTDSNGLPVILRPEAIWDTGFFNLSQFSAMGMQATSPAHQKGPFMSMVAQSGLNNQGQKIAQFMLGAYDNAVINDSTSWLLQNPFFQMIGPMIPDNGIPLTRMTPLNVTMARGESIPVGQMAAEAEKAATAAQQQLDDDLERINDFNSSLDQINDRVVPVLEEISGQKSGSDTVAWQSWLNNLVGFNSLLASEPPTVTETVPLTYQPQPMTLGTFIAPIEVQRISCFGAGTKVRALTGLEPIERLKVGDQVLTQNMKTGALGYKAILVVHHNPPSKTYQIKLGAETVVSSYFHRFWKAGNGWVMARDLKVGDSVRTLNGIVQVAAITEGRVVPVFNLDVADDADFFVGDVAALAHDNTLPNLRETPFDALITPANASEGPSHR